MKITLISQTAPRTVAEQMQQDHGVVVNPELVIEATGQQANNLKWLVGILMIMLLSISLYVARDGAAFHFGNTGTAIAWVFGLLSIIGIFAYLKGWLPKHLKWVVFLLELVNLGFDVYVADGQWTRVSVNSAVVNYLDERRHESDLFVQNINAFVATNNALQATGENIKEQEKSRDGEGTVYEAAGKLIAEFSPLLEVSITYPPISKDSISRMSSLADILDFTARYQRNIANQEATVLAVAIARKGQAEGFSDYLFEIDNKMASGYSQERKANLMALYSGVKKLAEFDLPTEPPAGIPLTKAEIKKSMSWDQYIVVPLIFVFLSAIFISVLFFWGGKGADRKRLDREVTLLLAKQKLENSGLQHTVPTDWFPTHAEMQLLDLMDDPEILVAIKRSGMSYERIVKSYTALGQENFVAIVSGRSKSWPLGEAVKVAEQQEYSAFLHDIINRLTPREWATIHKFCDRPGDMFRLSDDALKYVLLLIDALRTKLSGDDVLMNSTIDRLFAENGDDRYYSVLLRLIQVAKNKAQIDAINKRLVDAISVETMEFVCSLLNACPSDEKFIDIATNWKPGDTEVVAKLQNNKLSAKITPLAQKCVRGSYSLLRELLEAYDEQVTSGAGLVVLSVTIDDTVLMNAMSPTTTTESQLRPFFATLFIVR